MPSTSLTTALLWVAVVGVAKVGVAAMGVASDLAHFDEMEDDIAALIADSSEDAEYLDSYLNTKAMYRAAGKVPDQCTGGSALLEFDNATSPCNVRRHKTRPYINYIQANGECLRTFNTEAPGKLKFKLLKADIQEGDSLVLDLPFGDKLTLTNKNTSTPIIVIPSTSGSLNFKNKAGAASTFILVMLSTGSKCHKVIHAPAGSTGTLKFKNYKENSACEWRINAPEGKQIKLNFGDKFEVGTGTPPCKGSDYVGVDKSGDPAFSKDSERFCGNAVPGEISSNNNKISILANGIKGGKRGFTITYTVAK